MKLGAEIQVNPVQSPKVGGQVLHCQLISTTIKTHHKKFQFNRSRNGLVTKNSKNLWWWWVWWWWWWVVGSKQELSHSDRLVVLESVSLGQRQ